MFKMWVADVDSPSYFVATAAVDLGFFEAEGLDIELVLKTREGPELLRDGQIAFIAGPAYCAARAFPQFRGAKLLCALSQYSYWFLAVRADLRVEKGDLDALKGLRIAASPFAPTLGLRYMLAEAGFDLARDGISLVNSPPPVGEKGWMGRNGIDAIVQGTADAFWGNGMRVAIGEHFGIAKMHLDLRRGDGPPGARFYNFPALTTSEAFIAEHPDLAAGAVRAIVRAQDVLKVDASVATGIAARHFPADEVPLIATLIGRDAPFYDPRITREAIEGMMTFCVAQGIIDGAVSYEDVVATGIAP